MRIALGLEYNGAFFCGWQSQPSGQAVQDALSGALSKVAATKIWPIAAGRTDAGVHAFLQIVHYDTNVKRPLTAWVRGANAMLPKSMAVLWAQEVSEDFHARFSAQARTYHYFLLNRVARPGLEHQRVGWICRPLSLEAMQKGVSFFCGTHDFSSFRSSECQAKSAVRTVFSFEVLKKDDLFVFKVKANAFLHKMVRNMVAALAMVGLGKQPPYWIGELLEAKNNSFSLPTASPFGLYLAAIDYEPFWQLPNLSSRYDTDQDLRFNQ